MQRSSEQPLVGEERYVTTLITTAKETTFYYIRGFAKMLSSQNKSVGGGGTGGREPGRIEGAQN